MRAVRSQTWLTLIALLVLPFEVGVLLHLFKNEKNRTPASRPSTHAIRPLELPEHCLVNGSESGDLYNEVVLSLGGDTSNMRSTLIQHMRSNTGTPTSPRYHQIPKVIFVKEECASILETRAQEHALALQFDPPRFLEFESSSPRPYCGVPVQLEVCTSLGSRLSSLLVSLDSPSPPSMVVDLVEFLRVGFRNDADATARIQQIQDAVVLYAVAGQNGHNFGPPTAHWKAIPETNLFRPSYRIENRVSGVVRFMETRQLRILEDDSPISLNTTTEAINFLAHAYRTYDESERPHVQELNKFIEDRSENIYRFWEFEREALLRPTFIEDLDPQDFLTQLRLQFSTPLSRKLLELRSEPDLIFQYSETIIRAASRILRAEAPESVHRVAIAHWWAARRLQIVFGCESAENSHLSSERRRQDPLILAQYRHQTCRRQLSSSLYYLANREIESTNVPELQTARFSLIWAMSSRLERLKLLRNSMDRMTQRLQEGENLPLSTFSWISFHYLQTLYEERASRVLTWNGLVPADQEDLLQLNLYQNRYQKFLFDIRPYLLERRFAQPDLLYLYYTLVEKLASFDSQFVSLIRSEYQIGSFDITTGSRFLSDAIRLTHSQNEIESLRLRGLALISEHATEVYTLSPIQVCDLWQRGWDEKRFFDTQVFHIPSSIPCISAVANWKPLPNYNLTPSQADEQCEDLNTPSSCKVALARIQSEFTCEHPEDLENWLTASPRSFSLFKDAYDTLSKCDGYSFQSLFSELSRQLKLTLEHPFPSRTQLLRCFNARQWSDLFTHLKRPDGFCEIRGMVDFYTYISSALGYSSDESFQDPFEDSVSSAATRVDLLCTQKRDQLISIPQERRVSDPNIQLVNRKLQSLLQGHRRAPWLTSRVEAWSSPLPTDAIPELLEYLPSQLLRIQRCQSGIRR